MLRDLAVVVVLYFVMPLGGTVADPVLWIRLTAVVVGFSLVAVSIARRVRRQLRTDTESRPLDELLVAVVAGVLFSAVADYLLATARPGQFEGLATRIDALYFALTTLTTVGYGDIHAVGQLARGLLIVQMLFNVGVIATGAGVAARALGRRLRPIEPPTDDPPLPVPRGEAPRRRLR